MDPIKQSTYESCLATSLMMLAGNKPDKDQEVEIWKSGWSFNYLIGQLNYFSKENHLSLKAYIENKYYFHNLEKERSKNVYLVNQKIDLRLVRQLLDKGALVLYIDNYYLQKIVHAPHFILVLSKKEKSFTVADPFDGKLKEVSDDVIKKAVISLRNHLKYSPALITISQGNP